MKINFIGTILGIDGYSSHCRQLVNALYEINPDIRLDVPLTPDWTRHVNDAELNMITKQPRKADVTISISQPQFWCMHMDNCDKFVGFLVWEGDVTPFYWTEYLYDRRVNLIFVPSIHTKNAILNTLERNKDRLNKEDIENIQKKIRIVPHGVDLNVFKPIGVKRSDNFTFICNKGWRGGFEDRGGVAYVIKAFCEEFDKDEPIELFLKLNPSYINPQTISNELNKLDLPVNRPNIRISCDNIAYKDLSQVYCQGDVYVCAQRSDAFNLPGIEAMACELPTIQTGYGGQQDYMTTENSWSIDYTLVDVEHNIQYEGIKWAVPNIEYLKKLMREVYQNKKETKEKGKKALEDAKNWTWHISAKKALDFLNEL